MGCIGEPQNNHLTWIIDFCPWVKTGWQFAFAVALRKMERKLTMSKMYVQGFFPSNGKLPAATSYFRNYTGMNE